MPVPYVDTRKAEELFRYRVLRLLKDRELLSQERIEMLLSWRKEVFYVADGSHDDREDPLIGGQRIDRLEFLARVITQIPEPRRHLLFYYGHYAHRVRGKRLKSQSQAPDDTVDGPSVSPARKAALRRRWAHLIRRVLEVDPLVCDRCGGNVKCCVMCSVPSQGVVFPHQLSSREGWSGKHCT